MDNQRFLGLCFLISAVLLAGALYLHARSGRYQLQQSTPPGVVYILDTWTGEVRLK